MSLLKSIKEGKSISKFAIVIETVFIFGIFQILTGGLFLSSRNLSNLLMQSCTFAILGISMTLIMVASHIDLSVGSVVGCLGAFAAYMEVNVEMNPVLTIIITILLSIVIYAWQGYWVAYQGLPAFIVTLSGQLLFKGLTLMITKGASIGPMSDEFSLPGRDYLPNVFFKSAQVNDLSVILVTVGVLCYILRAVLQRRKASKSGLLLDDTKRFLLKTIATAAVIVLIGCVLISYKGIPYAGLLLVVLALVFSYIAKNTPFGRSIYAIGGNVEAARLSGINIKKVNMLLFLVQGLIVGIASVVFLGRIGQATAVAGTNFEFTAITGCIVGGTSTLGGIGTIPGASIGTILMSGIDNGMSLMNLPTTIQYLVKAIVLLLAVAVDVSTKRKRNG